MFDMPIEVLKTLPIWFAATLFSMTFHEAAHAWIGGLGGDRTAENQVTLDPTPHIMREPVGMLAVPLLTFFLYGGGWMMGWASAPYDPRWAERHPRRAALMAAAGPISNFVLAAVAAGALLLMVQQGHWAPATLVGYGGVSPDNIVVGLDGEVTAMSAFLSILFTVNLLLGCFNLIPLAPLDGHAVVAAFMPETWRRKWFRLFEDRSSQMIGMLGAWIIFGKVGWPIIGAGMFLLLEVATVLAG